MQSVRNEDYKEVDQAIAERKARFLLAYTKCRGLLYMAAKRSGQDPNEVEEWKRTDKRFAESMVGVERNWADEVASRLYDKTINDKKSQGNMLAIIYTLKNKHPDFRENQQFFESPRPLWFGQPDNSDVIASRSVPLLDNKSDNLSSDSVRNEPTGVHTPERSA